MKYVAVIQGNTVVNAVPSRVRWIPRFEKVINKHIKLYHQFKHETQEDAISGALKELNKIKDFKGTLSSVRARFYKLNKQDDTVPIMGDDQIVSCKVILKYASGKKTIIDNLNSNLKLVKQF